MNQEFSILSDADCSCLQIEVLVHESWIDRFMADHQLIIPVSESYHLINLKADLAEGKLSVYADIQEKEGSSIRITCLPKWDATLQQIHLEELKLDLVSKNILLKSAGWFAKTFMGAKIDKKIEEAASRLYTEQMETLLKNGILIPIPKVGSAGVQVRSVVISEMIFIDHSIKVKAMIDGYWKLELKGEEKG
ncbi:MAG: DUF4403 family protein [Saprospiraceae bacterium]|nr:DUF4403 family protein [Candidatus Opimibacter iunctus]